MLLNGRVLGLLFFIPLSAFVYYLICYTILNVKMLKTTSRSVQAVRPIGGVEV